MKRSLLGLFVTFGLYQSALLSPAVAADVTVDSQFQSAESKNNAAGGLSYLANGDLIALTNEFSKGSTLYIFDANGDGVPAGGKKELAQFDSLTFPSFVEVSPSGTFALAGVTGKSTSIFKIDLSSGSVSPYFSAPGNYDLVFIDDTHAYLSANPGGFNAMIGNRISLVDLTDIPTLKTVAEIFNTPSGPITLNREGDLYYIKGTFLFPTPAGSSTLMKFSAADLAAAASSGVPLGESASELSVPLDGGYDAVFQSSAPGTGQVFISTIKDSILRVAEGTTTVDVFATLSDPTGVNITALSFFKPLTNFDTSGPTQSVLAASVTTNFFQDYSVLQIRSVTNDADGDATADGQDQCPLDAAKVVVGVCGCGVVDNDTNGDGVVDCGAPRVFSSSISPTFGDVKVTGRSLKLQLEKLSDPNVTYRIEIRSLKTGKKQVIDARSSSVRIRNFSKGRYRVKYRLIKKNRNRTTQSASSSTIVVKVS